MFIHSSINSSCHCCCGYAGFSRLDIYRGAKHAPMYFWAYRDLELPRLTCFLHTARRRSGSGRSCRSWRTRWTRSWS